MKTIIAGSRTITGFSIVQEAIEESGFEITEVVSGDAKGVDSTGTSWGLQNELTVTHFPADWDNIEAPGAVIRINKWGRKYNAKAGYDRNEKMAQYADALIAIWDGKSSGTKNMIDNARKYGLKVYIKLA